MTGEELKELRNQMGISQQKLADIVGCHQRNIQNWEYERSKLTGANAFCFRLLKQIHEKGLGKEFGIEF